MTTLRPVLAAVMRPVMRGVMDGFGDGDNGVPIPPPGGGDSRILLESGDLLLLEIGDAILLENGGTGEPWSDGTFFTDGKGWV